MVTQVLDVDGRVEALRQRFAAGLFARVAGDEGPDRRDRIHQGRVFRIHGKCRDTIQTAAGISTPLGATYSNKRFLTATATLSVSSGCSRSALPSGPTPKASFNVCSTSPPPIRASNGLIVTDPNPASTSIERTRFGSANANGPGAVGSGGATVNSRELPVDLHDALCLLTARRASEYPSFVSEVPWVVIRMRASCQYR